MKIKIHSSEINRMMKTIIQCVDPKLSTNSNIEITHENDKLMIYASNSQYNATVSTPILGGDGESFCVDGTLFAKVCAMCSGDIDITTDSKSCIVKGAGRTRLPIVDVNIPHIDRISGNTLTVKANAEDIVRGFCDVSYAVSTSPDRIQLTGVLMRSKGNNLKMVALDGFKMSVEPVQADADDVDMIVPAVFLKLLNSSVSQGEKVTIVTDGHRIEAFTDSMLISGGLLNGQYPDFDRIMPTEFKTECLVDVNYLRDALKRCGVVNTENNLVKLVISEDYITVMSNSERADFEEHVECLTNGDVLKIAFNHKFLMETINSVNTDRALLKFNSPVSPCVVSGTDNAGQRLLLPVRVAGQ